MSEMIGHEHNWSLLSAALSSGRMHHGWILAGPRGLGKAHFARRAAAAIVDPEDRYGAMLAGGTFPDILTIERLSKDGGKDDEGDSDPTLKRSISMEQIRGLQSALTMRAAIADRRVVIIDSADDLERNGANALLKSLEEPPVGTIFLLVSHASDRLLPTIRSRCRMLRFDPLSDANMETAIRNAAPDTSSADMAALVRAGGGAPGQALAYLGLNLGELEDIMAKIIDSGDPSNLLRSEMAEKLNLKAAQPRYEAFLRRAPALIAEKARVREPAAALTAVDAWQAASALAQRAVVLSLDKQAVVFQMGALLASLRTHKAASPG